MPELTPPGTVAAVLERARQTGSLGPAPVADHVAHSLAFARAWAAVVDETPSSFVDLGTGGGVPGLVLADHWADAEAVLLDARLSRVTALTEAVTDLGWAGRVAAVHARAEDFGRVAANRERFPVVVARGFASPAVTAECAAPLAEVGGALLVSEPPVDSTRWRADRLTELGLSDEGTFGADHAHVRVLRKLASTHDRYPRRAAALRSRPLW